MHDFATKNAVLNFTRIISYFLILKVQLAIWSGMLHLGGRVVDVLALPQVAINSPSMQPCTVCLGASCGDGLRELVTPYSVLKTSIIKI